MVKDYDLREIFNYINDTALFKNQWQLKTASQEDYARLVEEKYRPIKKQLEEDVIAAGWFEPKVVYGYFPAQGDGNDVVVYDPSGGGNSAGLEGYGLSRPRANQRLRPDPRTSPLHLPAAEGRPPPLHLRFLCRAVIGEDGCDWLVVGDDWARKLR